MAVDRGPPSYDRVQPQAFYLAGVDPGVSKIIAVVTDLEGNVVSDTARGSMSIWAWNRSCQASLT